MSIASEISRISQNVSNSLDAVAAKGVTVPSGSNSDDLADLIGQIAGSPNLQAKTNISPTTSSQTIQPDAGYDGLSSVQINAMPSGTVTAPASITGTSATVSTGTNTLTLTKTVSVTPSVTTAGYVSSGTAGNSSVSLTASVNTRSSSDLTASTLTVTAPAGYYSSSASKTLSDENLVAGNIKKDVQIFGVTGTYEGGGGGTETIIIPEQTITVSSSYTRLQFYKPLVVGDEYTYTINGSTGTITCVNQYGSFLCPIFINGNYVYFDYSSPNMYFDVNDSSQYGTYTVKLTQQSGGGGSTLIEKTITANGVYNASDDDADGYSKVTVNVSGSGGLVYETGTYTPASDIAKPTISFANTHTTLPMFIMFSDAKGDVANTTNTGLSFYYMYHERVFGQPVYITSSSLSYGNEFSRYKASSASSSSNGSNNITASDTYSGGTTGTAYPRYYTTESAFYPYTNSSSRYWRSGRTYKWIAVWAPTT